MKVKEYVDFAHFENDPHRQDVDLICIVGKPNGYVCADFITDCRRWQTAFRPSTASRCAPFASSRSLRLLPLPRSRS